MLAAIWTSSVLLCVLALGTMVLLVARRLVQRRIAARHAAARRRLLSGMIRFSEDQDAAALGTLVAATPDEVVADAGFEFLSLLRGEEHARIIAVFAAAGVPGRIRSRLDRRREAQRLLGVEILSDFPEAESIACLLAILRADRSAEVRIAAAIALARLDALPPLAEVLSEIGTGGRLSRRMIDLLRRLSFERTGELTDYAVSASGSPFLRAAAIEALSRTGEPRWLGLFSRLAHDAAPEVATAAVGALGKLGHPGALPTLVAAMSGPNWEARAEAAEAAGRLEMPAAIAPLSDLLEDEIWAVRYAAGKALRRLGPEGEAALGALAAGPLPRSQRTASLVLGEGLAA